MIYRPFTTDAANVRDAGFAPKSDERIARSARAEEKLRLRFIREAERGPKVHPSGLDQPMPPEFLAAAMGKLELHLSRGHWEQAVETIWSTAEAWQIKCQESRPLAMPHPQRLALTPECLGLDRRTCELCERLGIGTAGSLLEDFPESFIELPNVGPRTIDAIAAALVKAGLIDADEAQRRIGDWNMAMDLAAVRVRNERRLPVSGGR